MLKKRKKEKQVLKNDLTAWKNCKLQVYEVQPLQVIVTQFSSSQGATKSFIILDKQKI